MLWFKNILVYRLNKEIALSMDELEQQLFDLPFSHFRDCLTPLMQLKDGKWTIEKAIQYLDELRTEGYVDNSSYGFW